MDVNPGSVLILDVTSSSAFPNPAKLSVEIGRVVDDVKRIAVNSDVAISVIHRRGDEIFVVGQDYATAYILAFWIRMLWKHRDFPLYCGIGYGDLLTEVPVSFDIEAWNSPIAKSARLAIQSLKEVRKTNRQWLRFDSQVAPEVSAQLNEYVDFQHRFLTEQTPVERLTSILSLVEDRKGEIAKLLHKDISTVSRQLKNSNIDLVLTAKTRVIQTLDRLQMEISAAPDSQPADIRIRRLHHRGATRMPGKAFDASVKEYVRTQMQKIVTDFTVDDSN